MNSLNRNHVQPSQPLHVSLDMSTVRKIWNGHSGTLTGMMLLSSILLSSFEVPEITAFPLAYTKWTSPDHDDCQESLCFTSFETVIHYKRDQDMDFEVGYEVSGDTVLIHAYSNQHMDPSSRLILVLEGDTLRQLSHANNSFCRQFVKIPNVECD